MTEDEKMGDMMVSIVVPKIWNIRRRSLGMKWKYIMGRGMESVMDNTTQNRVKELEEKISKMSVRLNQYAQRTHELETKYNDVSEVLP